MNHLFDLIITSTHHNNVFTLNSGGWTYVKFLFDSNNTVLSSNGHIQSNYYLNINIIKQLLNISNSFLFREDSRNVLAKTNTTIYSSIKNNINSNYSWFSNTHGDNSIEQYFIPINSKKTPYAQQKGCNGYINSNLQITNSCNNYLGSHSDLDNLRTLFPISSHTENSTYFIAIK